MKQVKAAPFFMQRVKTALLQHFFIPTGFCRPFFSSLPILALRRAVGTIHFITPRLQPGDRPPQDRQRVP
jgi:hypothetical protein